jgi:hypothetical protein
MKERILLSRLVLWAFMISLLLGFVAYWLQPFDRCFTWVLLGSVIVLIWICITGAGLFIEFLVEEDSGQ